MKSECAAAEQSPPKEEQGLPAVSELALALECPAVEAAAALLTLPDDGSDPRVTMLRDMAAAVVMLAGRAYAERLLARRMAPVVRAAAAVDARCDSANLSALSKALGG